MFFWSLPFAIKRWSPVEFIRLNKRHLSEAKPFCHLSHLYARCPADMPLQPHANVFHLSENMQHALPPRPAEIQLSSSPQIKYLSGKFDRDFAWPLNWTDRARVRLWASAARNGWEELENGRFIDLPVTFYPISIMLTRGVMRAEMGFTVWWMGRSLEQAAGAPRTKGQLY